ncbi:S8 family peptidase [Mucilaginibacter mallensis]|nr:S8 family serine peptidase [Mucilaginibacter mallensis]
MKLPILLRCCFLICLCFLFTACKKSPEPAAKPSTPVFDPSSLNISKSPITSYRLDVKLDNILVAAADITWSSSDIRIATVNSQGFVTALAAGKTDITATLLNGKGSAICKITVIDTNSYKFRIVLKDKGTSGFSISNPSQFLSAKAIARRQKRNIAIDDKDLPISADYIKAIQKVGGVIVAKSKWLGTVSVYCDDELLAYEYKKLPFVKDVFEVWQGKKVTQIPQPGSNDIIQKTGTSSATATRNAAYYGASWLDISMSNGQVLHQNGYEGAGIDIAVIDAGFKGLNTNSTFNNTSIKGAKSFVYENADPFAIDSHGVWVTSCMGVDQPGNYVGTAPAANYWLLRTEDESSEFPIEEDYWASAIEYADSLGVDMVNTSLTYTYHDGPTDNYTYQSMDGKTAVASRAADIAVDKGIFIVCCAGNEQSWVGAPADAPGVLTVGSVNKTGTVDFFSSFGITVDGRVKPDVMALGGGAGVIDIDGKSMVRSGTSYASPIMCGLAACLWQAYPKLTNKDLLDVIRKSADRFDSPVMPYGYGKVDMQKAMLLAKTVSDLK